MRRFFSKTLQQSRCLINTFVLFIALALPTFAAQPRVQTVPWIPSDPAIPHDTIAGRGVTLKGTSSVAGPQVRATWDFGDGSAPQSFTVMDPYAVSATHTYNGTPGTTFHATLTITDTSSAETASATYLVAIREKSLDVEVNIAIDEGLWYLHKTMVRASIDGEPAGVWLGSCGAACDDQGSANAVNVLAFERHGHLESGDSADPYTETVARGLTTLLQQPRDQQRQPDALWLQAISAAKSLRARAPIGPDGTSGRPSPVSIDVESTLRDLHSLDLDARSLFDLSDFLRSHPAPLESLQNLEDWYGAEAALGAPTDGVARVLVNRQNAAGFWTGHSSAPKSTETGLSLSTLVTTPNLPVAANVVTNVTSQVFISVSGAFQTPTVTISNMTGAPIPGPLSLGVFLNCGLGCVGSLQLYNQTGIYNGDPYITISAGPLNPGQSASVTLLFATVFKSNFSTVVYSGTMPPGVLSLACPANTAQIGVAYNSSFAATGGVLAYNFLAPPGTLPGGLTLNSATGAVTGNPSATGTFNFTGTVTDSTGRAPQTATANCTITVGGGNNKPTAAAAPPSLTLQQDAPATPIQISASDTETSAINMIVTITQTPAHGVLRFGANLLTVGTTFIGTPFTITYQPNAGYFGPDSFKFKATDRGAPENCGAPGPNCAAPRDSDEVTVPITVNPVQGGGTVVTNVTPQLNISSNGGFPNPTIVVTNTSGSPIPGPLNLGVYLTCGVGCFGTLQLLNQTGTYNTDPYIFLTNGPLNPGQSASVTLQLGSSLKSPINLVVYSGVMPPGPLGVACPSNSAQLGVAYTSAITGSGAVLPYSFSITGSLPSGLNLNTSTGAITGTPTAGGLVNFTAKITDSTARVAFTASAACSINVSVNTKPTSAATPPSLTILEDAAATPVQLTANDVETAPANLKFTITQAPAHGTLKEGATVLSAGSILSTGSPANVTYQPTADYNGSDSFGFKVTDRGNPDNCAPGPGCGPPADSDPIVVPITITAVNDAPSFNLIASPNQRTVQTAGPQTVANFATNISAGPPDEAGQTLTFLFTGNTNPAIFAAGPAISSTGTLTYTPAAPGTSTLTVVLKDNGGTANGGADTSTSRTFTITVNTPPVSSAQSVSTNEDTALPITLSATDTDGDALTYTIVSNPSHGTALPASGAMTCSGTPSSCTASVTYTPTANYNGPDSFTFRTNDGMENSTTVTVSITVNPVNDAPTANPQSGIVTPEATPVAITLTGSDLETAAANLSFTVTTPPAHGSLTGTAPNVTYTPTTGYSGPDSFQFRVTDRGDPDNCGAPSATCSAPLNSTPATVSITVSPVNTAPTATPQSVSVSMNVPRSITLAGTDAETPAGNLSFTVTSSPTHGTLSGTAPNLTYTPNTGYFGPDSFQFTVTDRGKPDNCGAPSSTCSGPLTSSAATVSITVSPVNTAPTATPQSVTTNESTAKPITLAGTDAETAPANLSFTITTPPAHGSLSGTAPNITYTPTAGYFGPDSFQFTVTDRGSPDNCGAPGPGCSAALTSSPATVSITVSPVNTAPTATPQSVTTNEGVAKPIVLGGTDSETATANLTFNVTVSPTHGSLTGTAPNLTYTPNAGYFGPDSFQFTVTDRGKPDNCGAPSATCAAALTSAAATISITVSPVNTAPTANAQSVSTIINTALPVTLTGADTETLLANLTFNVTVNPTHGSLSGTAPNLTYTPNNGYTGPDSFQFTVTDRGKPDNCGAPSASCAAALTSTAATITIAVNQPPSITSANNTTFQPGKVGQSFTVTTVGFPTGASMLISATGTFPTGVGLTDNHNGTATIAGTPAALTQNGSPYNTIVITANNGIAPNATQNFTLNVVCPTINVSGANPLGLIFNVAANSTYTQSGGNGAISWSASGLPTNLVIGSGTGTITGTPNVTGTFSASVTATDAGGCTGTLPITVSVGPNLSSQSYTGVGNTQLFVSGVSGAPTTPAVSTATTLLNGATPSGGVLITGANCTTGGALSSVDGAGNFIFTPNVSATSATCTYTASSNTGAGSTGPASATASLTFTLNNRVWYVSHGSSGTHDGRSNTPFSDMGGGANNLDCTATTGTGDFIYIAQGTGNTTGACALKTNQSFIGAGATLSVGGILNVPGNTASTPTVTGTLSASSATGLTVNGVSMNTGAQAAVNFTNSDGTFNFRSISSSGGTHGITWSNTSAATGSFTVSGDGTNNASGGTIQSTSSDGILLTNTHNVSLTSMRIQNIASGSGVKGTGVNNFTFDHGTISSVGSGASGSKDSALAFNTSVTFTENNVNGTLTLTNSTITNPGTAGLGVDTWSGTISNLIVQNNTFSAAVTTASGDAIHVLAQGSASTQSNITTGTVSGNTISDWLNGTGINVQGGNTGNSTSVTIGSAANPIVITNNSITRTNPSVVGDVGNAIVVGFNGQNGVSNWTITNNGTALTPLRNFPGLGISVAYFGNVTGTTLIDNNHIDSNNQAGSSGIGVQADQGTSLNDVPNASVTITNNVVENNQGSDIRGIVRNSHGILKLKIANNTVSAPTLTNRNGIRVDGGLSNIPGSATTLCLNISGNTSFGSGVNAGIGVRQEPSAGPHVFGLQGISQSSPTTTDVTNFINGQNPNGHGTDVLNGTSFSQCNTAPI